MGSVMDRNGKPKMTLEDLFYKNYESAVRNPSASLDSEIVSKIPLSDCKDNVNNGSVMDKHLVSENKNIVLEIPLTSEENESLLANLTTCKNYGNVVENTWPSSDNKSPIDFPLLVSENNTGVLENLSVLENAEDEGMFRCTNNLQGDVFRMETSLGENSRKLDESEDVNVDIIEYVNSRGSVVFEANDDDRTESSSSFDDSISENEYGSGFGEVEVNSPLFIGNTPASTFTGLSEAFHKRKNKRLTDHWKNFIRHIKWRCGWIELHWKELDSQSLRYQRELAKLDHRKQFEFELDKRSSEEVGVKSLPFCNHVQRTKIMKRKKRKRVEDSIDIAAYMCHHNLFSYFENKKYLFGGIHRDDKGSKPVIPNDLFGGNDEWSKLQFRDEDDSLEQILRKIDVMQSQVQKMKSRADKVLSEIPQKLSSINRRSSILVPCKAITSSQDPAFLPCDKDIMQTRPNSVDHPPVQTSYRNTEEVLVIKSEKERLDSARVRVEQHASTVPTIQTPEGDQAMETYAECGRLPVRSVTTAKRNASNDTRKSKRTKVSTRKWT